MSILAAQAMGSHFAVAPGNANTITGPIETFTYGLYWPEGASWSGLVSDDGIEKHDFAKGDGVASGNIVAFAFEKALPGIQYRGLLVDGDITLSLFGCANLCALQHPGDPCSHLPFPNLDDQVTSAPPSDADPPPGADSPEPASTDDAIADDDLVDDYPVDRAAVANAASSPPPHPTATPFA